MNKYPKITHVAIRYAGKTWSLPAPNRHSDVVRIIGGINGPDVKGFLDETGKFLTRSEAALVAKISGQVREDFSCHELYSEDIW